jgi:Tol biopolymer transport system component
MEIRKRMGRSAAVVAAGLALVVATAAPGWAAGTTTRASVNTAGVQGNGGSGATYTAGTGRFVVYESDASNLVKGDTNGVSDIFLRDRQYKKTYRISAGPINPATGRPVQANGPSHSARGITPDGKFVAFESFATNLVHNDFNGTWDVFVRSRPAKATYRVSVSSNEVAGNGPSADPVITSGGRLVAFESSASNLVPNDSNGAVTDVFLRDRANGVTSLVSQSTNGVHGNGSSSDPFISGDGRFVVFESSASNLVPNDTNGETDIFVRDRQNGTTSRVSVNTSEVQGNAGSYSARITPDGRYVTFESFSSNLTGGVDDNHVADVFVRDRQIGFTARVSVSSSENQGNGFSSDPTISADGRYVAFESAASNFAPNDGNAHVDVFIRDRINGTTHAASVSPGGAIGNAGSENPWFSADGRYLAFASNSSNLVPNDSGGHKDVFVRGPFF